MKTAVAVHQPNFVPWVGWWSKMAHTDTFVLLPKAQFSKGDYHNRFMFCGRWMTVPVSAKLGQSISDVKIAQTGPLHKMAKALRWELQSYPYAYRINKLLSLLESWRNDSLIELNMTIIESLYAALEMTTMVVDHKERFQRPAPEELSEIVEEHGGQMYMAGRGALDYSTRDQYTCPEVWLQNVKKGSGDILTYLVTRDNPKDDLLELSTWEEWEMPVAEESAA